MVVRAWGTVLFFWVVRFRFWAALLLFSGLWAMCYVLCVMGYGLWVALLSFKSLLLLLILCPHDVKNVNGLDVLKAI